MIERLFSFKNLRRSLVLVGLLLLLFVAPALSARVALLSDGFERPITFNDWDDNGITDWKANPSLFHSGIRSARASNNSEGLLTSNSLDASDAVNIVVDFWFYKIDTNDTGFTLYFYNGSTYNQIAELDSLGADNIWIHYTQTITDPQYFTSDFRLSFDATLAGGELAYVDDVLITKDTGETLTVTKTGNGTVTSTPAGIDCGLDCSETYPTNSVVVLSSIADPGWGFTGWSGDCTGSGPCQVTMDAAKSVAAEFKQIYNLSVSKTGSGSGTVTSSPGGIYCGDTCSADFEIDLVVTLSAIPDAGSTFTGWSGGTCTGTSDCIVTMDAAKTITAEFTRDEYTLTINVIGNGTVTKSPDQLVYYYGDVVQLTATRTLGWSFESWSGDLTGTTNPDSITMDGDKTVTATFTEIHFYMYLPQFYK